MREIVMESWRKGLHHIEKGAPWIRSWRQHGKGELGPQGKERMTGSHKDGGDRGSGPARGRKEPWKETEKQLNG